MRVFHLLALALSCLSMLPESRASAKSNYLALILRSARLQRSYTYQHYLPKTHRKTRKLLQSNVKALRRLLEPRTAVAASNLPTPEDVLLMDCSGWPEARRYLEVASWWTDDGLTPSAASHRVSMGACFPVEPVTGPIVVDAGVKLANCVSKRTLTVNRIWITALSTELMAEEGLGLSCCGLALCEQSMRYTLNMTALATNGHTELEMGLAISAPSRDRLVDNEFAAARILAPLSLNLPGVNTTTNMTTPSTRLQAHGRAHGPWQLHYMFLASLPSITTGAAGSMLPLPLEFYKYPTEADVSNTTTPAANFTGMLVSVDPSPSNVTGAPLLTYSNIDVPWMAQGPFVNATSNSDLSNGTHLVLVRGDAYIPTNKMPTDPSLPPVQRQGGTHSTSFTFGWKK